MWKNQENSEQKIVDIVSERVIAANVAERQVSGHKVSAKLLRSSYIIYPTPDG